MSDTEWFGSDAIRAVYRVQLGALFAIVAVVPFAVTAVVAPWWVAAGIGGLVVVLGAFFWWWSAAYERSLAYRFGDDEFEAKGGVFFRSKSTIPYTRITNVETTQGPVLRYFGVGSVAIQTAGRSGQTTAEVTVHAMADYEGIRDRLVERVSAERAAGDATGPAERSSSATLDDVLAELRAIRDALETERDAE